MASRIFSILCLLIFLLVSFLQICAGAGGMAEMKALTGDAPYVGTGNQEQAPEYFGEALMRQYYQNPAYAYDPGNYYGSRYSRNYYRTMQMQQPYRYYQPQYNGGGPPGGLFPFLSFSPLYRPPASPPAAAVMPPSSFGPTIAGGGGSPFGGSFYNGRGNDWVKN